MRRIAEYSNTLYHLPDHGSRDKVRSYAKDHGVFIWSDVSRGLFGSAGDACSPVEEVGNCRDASVEGIGTTLRARGVGLR